MNSIFGDATTAAPTPATLAEAESLFSGRSPVSPFRLNEGSGYVPEMDLQPPEVEVQDGKPMLTKDNGSEREGVGGWISNIMKRNKSDDGNGSGSGRYQRVGQNEDDDR